jgi:hypothetical protein
MTGMQEHTPHCCIISLKHLYRTTVPAPTKQAADGVEHIGFASISLVVSALLGLPLPISVAIMALEYLPLFLFLEMREVQRCLVAVRDMLSETKASGGSWCASMLQEFQSPSLSPQPPLTHDFTAANDGRLLSRLFQQGSVAGLPIEALVHPRFLVRAMLLLVSALFMTVVPHLLWNGRVLLERRSRERRISADQHCLKAQPSSVAGRRSRPQAGTFDTASSALSSSIRPNLSSSSQTSRASSMHERLCAWTSSQPALRAVFEPLRLSERLLESEAAFVAGALDLGVERLIVPLACLPVVGYTYIRRVGASLLATTSRQAMKKTGPKIQQPFSCFTLLTQY